MIRDLEAAFSLSAKGMEKSVIRELLKLTRRPEIISLAGGLPAPAAFPVEQIAEITAHVLSKDGENALQYSPTEGDPRLREQIILHHKREDGLDLRPENVLITVASQQGLDLVTKIFVDRGDPVMVGLPTYVGGLGALRCYGANTIGVPLDDDGMRVDRLESELRRLREVGKKPKLIYVVPDFQNPAGITMTRERRLRLVELAGEYDTLVLEDSPYKELRFEGERMPAIFSLDGNGQVIGLHTFSKILFPGMRLGWVIAHEDIIQKLVIAKQSTDLCTSAFTQAIVAEFCARGLLNAVIENVKVLYKAKREVMIGALEKYMPKIEGIFWTRPQGGLFLWLTLPKYMNADEMFYQAIERNVAYVVGSAFHCNGKGQNTMRLNFSYPSEEHIDEGIRRLAKVIEERENAHRRAPGVVVTP